jgi:hypothetical protein
VVLYRCETLSLLLREDHRLGVYKNGVENVWTGDEVEEEWRELHNEELHNL